MWKSPSLICLAVATTACNPGPVHALPSDSISINPSGVDVTLGTTNAEPGDPFVEEDGVGVLIIVDVSLVGEDGPRNGIEVEVTANGLTLIPEAAVRTVDPPELPEGISSRSDIEQACTDEEGNFSNEEEWCAWYYDVDSGTFLDFGSDFAFDGYSPSYGIVSTDSHGLARLYVFLDYVALTTSGDYALPEKKSIFASTGYSSDSCEVNITQ